MNSLYSIQNQMTREKKLNIKRPFCEGTAHGTIGAHRIKKHVLRKQISYEKKKMDMSGSDSSVDVWHAGRLRADERLIGWRGEKGTSEGYVERGGAFHILCANVCGNRRGLF
jgi:hypothetical protein